MSSRIDVSWKTDGFVNEHRYYISETPISVNNLPSPKVILDGEAMGYIDSNIELDKTYYICVSSLKNGVEKVSSVVTVKTSSRDEHFSSVVLLIFADSTSFPSAAFKDSSSGNRAVSGSGNVSIVAPTVAIPAKFDDGWIKLDGGRLNAEVPKLSAGDFTIEFELFDSGVTTSSYGRFFEIGDPARDGKLLMYKDQSNRVVYLQLYSGGFITLHSFNSKSYQANKAIHMCLMRINGVFYLYFNGVLIGSNNTMTTYNISQTKISIGADMYGRDALYANISSFRVTIGVARYNISGFNPPSSKFKTA